MVTNLKNWVCNHKTDLVLVTCLLFFAGIISGHNMAGYPQRFEDEGTYVSQAYTVEKKHTLTHYTYWYDHPPVGWIQIAGYTAVTHAFERYDSAISAGREFMLVIHLITIILLYALARRLQIGKVATSAGILLYSLSPLVIEYSRYVLLDNVALPWLLGAFLLALSPRRSIGTAIGSAVCMAVAILSKETFIVLLPVILFALWKSGDKRNRRFMLTSFGVVFIMVSGAYVLYAALKNELFPGQGHVSLLGTFIWQLVGRKGSGSIFDPNSATRGLVGYWLRIDPWLLAAGAISLPLSLAVRRLRPIGFALLIGLAMLLRTGYLPYPYVVVLLPFATITIAAVVDYLLKVASSFTFKRKWMSIYMRAMSTSAILALFVVAVVAISPSWQPKINALAIQDNDSSSRQAVAWILQNVRRENRLVVESALWTDLLNKGFDQPQPVWLYKTETDPEVKKTLGGYQAIDYVVLNGPTISNNSEKEFPTVYSAIKHAEVVAVFGRDNQKILIYKVDHNGGMK